MTLTRRELMFALSGAVLVGPGGILALLPRPAHAQGAQGIRNVDKNVLIGDRAASPGMAVNPGDTVATAAASSTSFVVGSDAFLLRENTRLEFGQGPHVSACKFPQGGVLCATAAERTFVTRALTVTVTEGACCIEAEPERTYFCLCYGSAVLQLAAAPDRRDGILAIRHDRPVYISAAGGDDVMTTAPFHHHTDEELRMLEGLVGRKPGFEQA